MGNTAEIPYHGRCDPGEPGGIQPDLGKNIQRRGEKRATKHSGISCVGGTLYSGKTKQDVPEEKSHVRSKERGGACRGAPTIGTRAGKKIKERKNSSHQDKSTILEKI